MRTNFYIKILYFIRIYKEKVSQIFHSTKPASPRNKIKWFTTENKAIRQGNIVRVTATDQVCGLHQAREFTRITLTENKNSILS